MFFFLLSSPVCVSLDLHMKVIDLVFYDLFIDTKTALRSGEKEGEREGAFHSSQHPFFSPALPPLQPSPLLLRKKTFSFSVVVDPPPSWSYINGTNHNSGRWETQDHLGPGLAKLAVDQ